MGGKWIDLTGVKFGKLEVIATKSEPGRRKHWLCRCDCGVEITVDTTNLNTGNSTSCGCSRIRHGMAGTKVFRVWQAMRQRCENPNFHQFADYGGRGITVDERWNSFEQFFEDMGYPPHGGTLDRKDNSLGYSKENCRWATWKEQSNNKRTNRPLEAFGRSQNIQQWATEFRLPLTTLRNRIDRGGWPLERALTEPLRKGKRLKGA